MKIEPTVGRMVWFQPAANDALNKGRELQPLSGQIAHVNDDATVNLCVLSAQGAAWPKGSVRLLQSEYECMVAQQAGEEFCSWMPYQRGQAARTEELERVLAAGGTPPPGGPGNGGAGPVHHELKIDDTQGTVDRIPGVGAGG